MAGGTVGAALIAPAVSLGPILDTSAFYETPWRRGRRLVGEDGKPFLAEQVEQKVFYTAFPEAEPKDALVCPCHYSTFDVATGGTVVFGPAGRDLPQLPLYVDTAGHLRAAGNFSGLVGPSWWGVRSGRARP